jgi:twinkle protein
VKPPARESSGFVRHTNCDACGSSDGNALYGDGSTYCWVCGVAVRAGDGTATSTRKKKAVAADIIPMEQMEIRPLLARKITEETCRHFGYGIAGQRQVAPYYDAEGHLVGQKVRGKDKQFSVRGEVGSKSLPFGAQCWPKSGRKLVVTEGEIDCLSMSQVQGNKWPVVSIPTGAGKQTKSHFAENLSYYSGFDEVVLMFDMDEPGREAAKEAASVLGKRARIAELPSGFKDANDMLKAGKTAELIDAMWKAKEYRPEGIVSLGSLKDAVKKAATMGLSWWDERLTALTYGIRLGEIYAFGAGTGVGKTDFFTQQMAHMVLVLGVAIGVFSLEQLPVETAKRIAGKAAGKPFHIPDAGWTEGDLDAAWAKLTAQERVFLYDSFGANEWGTIQEKIEYLVHAHGVRYFFLDHLTALAAGDSEEERVALERIMASMGALVKRLNITIFLVSHLATPEKGSHEEGARVTIRQFKGSRAIGFWSHFMFGLERNQQSDDPDEATTTTFRVLKDRYTGRATGKTLLLGYDRDTGMLIPKVPKETAEAFAPEEPGVPSDF